MSERIVTDSRGQRRDVHEDERGLVFRHQSGRELRADGNWPPLDELSTDELLDTTPRAGSTACRQSGMAGSMSPSTRKATKPGGDRQSRRRQLRRSPAARSSN